MSPKELSPEQLEEFLEIASPDIPQDTEALVNIARELAQKHKTSTKARAFWKDLCREAQDARYAAESRLTTEARKNQHRLHSLLDEIYDLRRQLADAQAKLARAKQLASSWQVYRTQHYNGPNPEYYDGYDMAMNSAGDELVQTLSTPTPEASHE